MVAPLRTRTRIRHAVPCGGVSDSSSLGIARQAVVVHAPQVHGVGGGPTKLADSQHFTMMRALETFSETAHSPQRRNITQHPLTLMAFLEVLLKHTSICNSRQSCHFRRTRPHPPPPWRKAGSTPVHRTIPTFPHLIMITCFFSHDTSSDGLCVHGVEGDREDAESKRCGAFPQTPEAHRKATAPQGCIHCVRAP